MDHPEDFGYPSLDVSDGTLIISEASDDAAAISEHELIVAIPRVARRVKLSYGQLQGMTDAIISLSTREGSNDWAAVWQIEPDYFENRLVVNVDELSASLLTDIALRFGDGVAVRVEERIDSWPADNRRNDPSSYYGGAQIGTPAGTCSDGFTWANGTLWYGVLTAAHCAHQGGNITCCTPNQAVGSVLSWSHENWESGNGTVGYSGSSINRGDVALVKLAANRSVSPRIWRGAADGTTSSPVRLVWGRWSQNGDSFCTGGRTTGEICGFVVSAVGISHWYTTGEWIRNAVQGERSGTCPLGGDSGGSVFTLYSDGVAAKGILSGTTGASDCDVWFTDIQHPVQALPGGVYASP
jgi:hypothetical protein